MRNIERKLLPTFFVKAALAASMAAAALALAPSLVSADKSTPAYTSLTVFGDSLVAVGDEAAHDSGYFKGRFTNGYDYTDLLSIDMFGQPTRVWKKGGNNFAVGGARILGQGDIVPDLGVQIGNYMARLARTGGRADPNGLYVLNCGGNDIFASRRAKFDSYGERLAYLKASAVRYAAAAQKLNDMGARNILIADFPAVNEQPTNMLANFFLDAALRRLTLAPDTTLSRFSYADAFGRAIFAPLFVGRPPLTLSSNCLQAQAVSKGCAGYLSFDGTHPTSEVQRAVYVEVRRRLGTWSLDWSTWLWLLSFVSLVAIWIRKRRRRAKTHWQVDAARPASSNLGAGR